MTELEREKIKYAKLYRVGITRREIKRLAVKELRIFFFVPFVIGALLALLFMNAIPIIIGDKSLALRYSLFVVASYFLFHGACFLIYKAYYGRKLVKSTGLATSAPT
jgi:hypothetical protein